MDNPRPSVDKSVNQLEALTHSLLTRIDQVTYEELAQFVDDRQPIMDEISYAMKEAPLPMNLQERVQKVLQSDEVILERMQRFKQEASDWLQNRGVAKTQRSAYEQAYTPDSIMMDRKK